MTERYRFSFLTVGPASWDTSIVSGLRSLEDLHEVIQVQNSILEQPGGTAVNTASTLNGLLQGVISVCGVTGNDESGEKIDVWLRNKGIDTSYLRHDLPKTPRSVNAITLDGEKHIFYDGNGLDSYRYPEEEFREIIVETPWAYFSVANFSRYLLPIAREVKATIATDLQALENLEPRYEEHLKYADILFASASRLKIDIPTFIRKVWDYGPQIVVVTDGLRGAVLGLNTSQKIKHYDGLSASQVLDSTGAGDHFAAVFCACLSEGLSVEESILKALIFSSEQVQNQGSIAKEISKSDLQEMYFELLKGKATNL